MPNPDYYRVTQHSRSGYCAVCERQENSGSNPILKKSQVGWSKPSSK